MAIKIARTLSYMIKSRFGRRSNGRYARLERSPSEEELENLHNEQMEAAIREGLRQGAVILVLPPPVCKKCRQKIWRRWTWWCCSTDATCWQEMSRANEEDKDDILLFQQLIVCKKCGKLVRGMPPEEDEDDMERNNICGKFCDIFVCDKSKQEISIIFI